MTETHILLVEDDPDIRLPLADFLRSKGFVVSLADSAEAAEELLKQEEIGLVLLDVMLPGKDGLDLCRRLRAEGDVRIIILTALSEATDKVVGLEVGADDYVTKPFDLRELLARIRALLRRTSAPEQPEPNADAKLGFAGFVFEAQRRFVRSPAGLRVPLTGAEADLLLIFCQNARRVISREELIGLTRGEGYAISNRSIDLLVSRLRHKLGDSSGGLIRTIRADGYLFQPQVVYQ